MWRINRILMKEAEAEKQSCIWETLNLSTDADSRTDTILEKLHYFLLLLFKGCMIFF